MTAETEIRRVAATTFRRALKSGSSLPLLVTGDDGAEWLVKPSDVEDLSQFLSQLDPAIPVLPVGVGSNLIVRDGGIRANTNGDVDPFAAGGVHLEGPFDRDAFRAALARLDGKLRIGVINSIGARRDARSELARQLVRAERVLDDPAHVLRAEPPEHEPS